MVLKESTTPTNDYFTAQFLVSFKYLGNHVITISAGVTDEKNFDWETGPSSSLQVEVYEQTAHRKK